MYYFPITVLNSWACFIQIPISSPPSVWGSLPRESLCSSPSSFIPLFSCVCKQEWSSFGLRGRAQWSNNHAHDQWLWRDLTSLMNVFHTQWTAEVKKWPQEKEKAASLSLHAAGPATPELWLRVRATVSLEKFPRWTWRLSDVTFLVLRA